MRHASRVSNVGRSLLVLVGDKQSGSSVSVSSSLRESLSRRPAGGESESPVIPCTEIHQKGMTHLLQYSTESNHSLFHQAKKSFMRFTIHADCWLCCTAANRYSNVRVINDRCCASFVIHFSCQWYYRR